LCCLRICRYDEPDLLKAIQKRLDGLTIPVLDRQNLTKGAFHRMVPASISDYCSVADLGCCAVSYVSRPHAHHGPGFKECVPISLTLVTLACWPRRPKIDSLNCIVCLFSDGLPSGRAAESAATEVIRKKVASIMPAWQVRDHTSSRFLCSCRASCFWSLLLALSQPRHESCLRPTDPLVCCCMI
jgi:hypothetical protein